MEFRFNSVQEEYRLKVKEVAKKLDARADFDDSNPQHYRDSLKVIANEGLFQPLIADNTDEMGLSIPIVNARETFSRYFPFGDFIFAEQALGIIPILLNGTSAQKEKYLGPLVNGEVVGGFALTEEASGSDASSLSCSASKNENGDYVLNGKKVWISNAPIGDVFIVFARTGEHRTKGVTAFIVDGHQSGMTRKQVELSAPHPIGELIFENCVIKKEQLLGQEGEGFKVAMSTMDILRPGVGAHAVGTAKAALDFIIAFTQERMSFNQPLSEFQSIQFKLSDMYTNIRSAQWLIYHCAWKRDIGEKSTIESSMAKMFATEMANKVLYDCVQINGARGVVKDSYLDKLSRIVRPAAIYEGTTEVQKLVIHRQLTKMFAENGEVL